MKKHITIALVITLAFTLAACGSGKSTNPPSGDITNPPAENTPTPTPTQSEPPAPPPTDNGGGMDNVSPGDLPPDIMGGGNDPYTAYDNATDQQKALSGYARMNYVDEKSGDSVIFFNQFVNDGYDNIAVLRGTNKNNLSVHEILPKSGFDYIERSNTVIERLYIDSGAAGNGYYYAVTGVAGGVAGVPEEGYIRQFWPIDYYRMYRNDSGFVRVRWESVERSMETHIPSYRAIEVFGKDGHFKFYADSGSLNFMGEVHGRDWMAQSSVNEQGVGMDFRYILFDMSDTMFEFFGVFDVHWSTPSDFPAWPPDLYMFTIY
ncbi:MAG: hypothetical protein FWD90_13615 [Defluviitaleaceae bacterium]|nr:hypothetical protein [Defluviitaleaceae bacterium]